MKTTQLRSTKMKSLISVAILNYWRNSPHSYRFVANSMQIQTLRASRRVILRSLSWASRCQNVEGQRLPERSRDFPKMHPATLPVGGFNPAPLKNMTVTWEGWHPIYYGKITNVPNHQPDCLDKKSMELWVCLSQIAGTLDIAKPDFPICFQLD